jgi:hypothetical protein
MGAVGRPDRTAAGRPDPTAADLRDVVTSVLDRVRTIALAHGRDDLAEALDASRTLVLDRRARAVVVGGFKQGKSSLIDSVLGGDLCPVEDVASTSVITVVRYADAPEAAIVDAGGRSPIPLDEAARHIVEPVSGPTGRTGTPTVEIGSPNPILAEGLVVVDTPGTGGLTASYDAAVRASLPSASAAVFVSDASQELTAPEVGFLRLVASMCPTVAFALTKIDLYPEWRRIRELNEMHLRDAGVHAASFPVSAALRGAALAAGDAAMDEESGYPSFVSWLRERVIAPSDRTTARAGILAAGVALEEIRTALQAERTASSRPEDRAALVEGLDAARAQLETLRSGAARWRVVLEDHVSDLGADVGYDLRNRLRAVGSEADAAIDASDPEEIWEELSAWLTRRVAADVAENYALLTSRANDAARSVATTLGQGFEELETSFAARGPGSAIGTAGDPEDLDAERVGVTALTLSLLAGGYDSFSRFGQIAGLIGMAAVSPFTLGLGLLAGGQQFREERRRRLDARRQQAKALVRDHLDEVQFHVEKDSRDALRRVEREIRDTFTAMIEERERSLVGGIDAAQRAVQRDAEDLDARTVELDARLADLRAASEDLARLAASPAFADRETG